jgi:hypothetical protein
MTTEIKPTECENGKIQVKVQGGASETVYAFGLIGAWVYYIGRATTFQERVEGFFKAFAWPAILVYALLDFFKKE